MIAAQPLAPIELTKADPSLACWPGSSWTTRSAFDHGKPLEMSPRSAFDWKDTWSL